MAPGANTILRDAKKSSVTIPDFPSFDYMKEKTDAMIAAGSESSGLEEYARSCGIPDRLFLPKGKETGLEMVLMGFLEDGEADKADDFIIDVNNEFGGTHSVVSVVTSFLTSVQWVSHLIGQLLTSR